MAPVKPPALHGQMAVVVVGIGVQCKDIFVIRTKVVRSKSTHRITQGKRISLPRHGQDHVHGVTPVPGLPWWTLRINVSTPVRKELLHIVQRIEQLALVVLKRDLC